MTLLHQDLTKEKWRSSSFFYQMANIGTEVGRTINWRQKDNQKSDASFERAIELLDLTIEDKKNHDGKLKELCRLREILVDYFIYDNIYGFSDKAWNDYFYGFNYAYALICEKSHI